VLEDERHGFDSFMTKLLVNVAESGRRCKWVNVECESDHLRQVLQSVVPKVDL
jgi:hypothetical protein